MKLSLIVFLPIFFSVLPAQAGNKDVGMFASDYDKIPITTDDIKDTSLTKVKNGYTLNVKLKGDAAKRLGSLTEAAIGNSISFSVCDEEILRPVVHAPIFSGVIQLQGLQPPLASKLNRVLTGKNDCVNW